ncbi:hypothetical protein [Aquimarina sp. RZ0]|uniref:hypothetical protein n=1 Tax=Aquimarina sp. RZ0 TaxID=2607730 RepID=UPI0011F12C0B|nr:hypothetical protein [Aquimarina sp. RZ0]KAA1242903.1 hypothetical protein F0000_23490 [Aquimarina sp. RZ0]
MIYLILPIDPTTIFLNQIPEKLKNNGIDFNLIEVYETKESYDAAKQKLTEIPNGATVLFLGHGQDNQLYGGASSTIEKQPIIRTNEMKIFAKKKLFALSCHSASLLKNSLGNAQIINSIGFGALPTEMAEVESNNRLNELGITEETIDAYKQTLVDCVVQSVTRYAQTNLSFHELKDFFSLLMNKRINEAVLVDKDRNLANLVFQMRNEMIMY